VTVRRRAVFESTTRFRMIVTAARPQDSDREPREDVRRLEASICLVTRPVLDYVESHARAPWAVGVAWRTARRREFRRGRQITMTGQCQRYTP